MRTTKEDVSSWEEECPYSIHHKNVLITPEFLEKHEIPYQVVWQQPGTLVYVREGVYHQVRNTGLMLAEAVNVGGPFWNCMSIQSRCRCQNAAIRPLVRNRAYGEKVTSHKVLYLPCKVDGCLNVAPTREVLKAHERQHRDGVKSSSCRLCPFTSVHRSTLKRHLFNCHPGKNARTGFTLCSIRGVLLNTPVFRCDQQKCLGGDVVCDHCHRSYSAQGYRKHRRT